MTELLGVNPTGRNLNSFPEATQVVGSAAENAHLAATQLVEAKGDGLPKRTMHHGGFVYETTLPEGLNIFSEKGAELSLRPSELDTLPIGDFSVSRPDKVRGEFEDLDIIRVREISVLKVRVGNVVGKAMPLKSFRAYDRDIWSFTPGTENLMTALGYIVTSGENYAHISAIPTPDTVVAMAAQAGVDIKRFPDIGHIPATDYVSTFAEGKYPVSTENETNYKHDIQDDHLTPVVLGGEPLKNALRDVAAKALGTEKIDIIKDVTGGIDEFTATLGRVLYSGGGEAYGIENGRRTLYKDGRRLGISDEVTENILKHAQSSAAVFGINVTPLQ